MEKIVNIDGQNKVLRLRILNDGNSCNPFKDWDCNPPILIDNYSNNLQEYGEDVREFIRTKLTHITLKRLSKKIANILEIENTDFSERCEQIVSELNWASIEQLHEVCELLKIKSKLHYSTGYGQGDAAKILVVITDNFLETTGANIEDSVSILKKNN